MNFLLYARKSTDTEERQVLSIDAQLAELREFARKGADWLEPLETFVNRCKEALRLRSRRALRRSRLAPLLRAFDAFGLCASPWPAMSKCGRRPNASNGGELGRPS